MEAGLPQLLGHALRVLGQLGERDVGVDEGEAGRHQLGLEPAEAPQVLAHRHDAEVGLVAEHGHRHHLHTVGLRRLHRRGDGLLLGPGAGPEEQVDDAETDRWDEGFRHAPSVRGVSQTARVGRTQSEVPSRAVPRRRRRAPGRRGARGRPPGGHRNRSRRGPGGAPRGRRAPARLARRPRPRRRRARGPRGHPAHVAGAPPRGRGAGAEPRPRCHRHRARRRPVAVPRSPSCAWSAACTPAGRVALAPGCHVLGRAAPSVLVVDDPTMSAVHAELRLEEGRAHLADAGSTNGTWLGGTATSGATTLGPGVVARLGATEVTVGRRPGHRPGAPAVQPPTAPPRPLATPSPRAARRARSGVTAAPGRGRRGAGSGRASASSWSCCSTASSGARWPSSARSPSSAGRGSSDAG